MLDPIYHMTLNYFEMMLLAWRHQNTIFHLNFVKIVVSTFENSVD